MELKCEGILPDGTQYAVELKCKDKSAYETLVQALQTQDGESAVKGGLILLISELEDITRNPDLSYQLLSVNLAKMQKYKK